MNIHVYIIMIGTNLSRSHTSVVYGKYDLIDRAYNMDSRLLILRNFEKRQRLHVEKDNEMNKTKKPVRLYVQTAEILVLASWSCIIA